MKTLLALLVLLGTSTAFASTIDLEKACGPILQSRTTDVVHLFTDKPNEIVTVEKSVYKETPLSVIDGEELSGKTYKVTETVRVGKGSGSFLISAESGIIAPDHKHPTCQVLYTSPGNPK